MKDDNQNLLDIYRDQPCRTLPNAFWKTSYGKGSLKLEIKREPSGNLQSLVVWQDERILSLWLKDPQLSPVTSQQIKELDFALVHNHALSVFDTHKFSVKTPYFRLKFNGVPPVDNCPSGFDFQTFDQEKDIILAASMISACYPTMRVDEDIVRGWMHHLVYDPNFWVWIKETQTGRYAALGIAELDQEVPEASLEWIQVHPDFQRRGLGQAVVGELLRRVSGKVDFTTVSGEIENPSQPEKLYRKCGFSGSDIWWLLKT